MIPVKTIKKFFFLVYIKMPNINQNIRIEGINKEISLLQSRLDINKKSLKQFKNRLMQIKRIQLQRKNLSEAEKYI